MNYLLRFRSILAQIPLITLRASLLLSLRERSSKIHPSIIHLALELHAYQKSQDSSWHYSSVASELHAYRQSKEQKSVVKLLKSQSTTCYKMENA